MSASDVAMLAKQSTASFTYCTAAHSFEANFICIKSWHVHVIGEILSFFLSYLWSTGVGSFWLHSRSVLKLVLFLFLFSPEGISGKSQVLFALVFTTRYLDLFTVFISAYNTVMKVRVQLTHSFTHIHCSVKLNLTPMIKLFKARAPT